MTLVLTAHGSADPRSAATAFECAERLRVLRPELEVRSAFCEQTAPHLRDVLRDVADGAVVTPLLLARAHHARADIPGIVEESGRNVRQADVLGEDTRLISVMRQRLGEAGVTEHDPEVGVIVVAVGSSWEAANLRTAGVASALAVDGHWAAVTTAFATGPQPPVAAAIDHLRDQGVPRIVLAPWFLAHGRLTDRVADCARAYGVEMTQPLGAHALVAETLLARYDAARTIRAAA